MSTFLVAVQFIFIASILGYSGFKLSFLADQIAAKTNLGRNLIGIIMLSTVTSLPELVTGISSVTVTDNPDLAVGDILGGCSFNLATVVLLDSIYRKGSVFSHSTQGHMFTGLIGMIMISLVGLSLILKNEAWFNLQYLGISSIFIFIFYFVGMKAIYNFEVANIDKSAETKNNKGLKRDFLFFGFYSILIILSGVFLPKTAENIINLMGWNSAFVGTFFMALATTLPEISVTISALRLNAAELAFSNLLGSNIFNVVILAITDVIYKKGPLLAYVADTHAVTAFSLLMMIALVLIALMKPPQKKFLNIISGLSFIILGIYIVTIAINFKGSLIR